MFPRYSLAFAGTMLLGGVAIAVASLGGEPERRLAFNFETDAGRRVSPSELADWIIEGRRDFAVVDMRSKDQYQAGHVRGAINCGNCHASKEDGRNAQRGDSFVDLSKKLIFYGQNDSDVISLPKVLHDNQRLYRLEGGYQGWQAEILAPIAFGGDDGEEERLAKRKRDAVRGFFTGERTAERRPAKLDLQPIRRKNAHKLAVADEGC